MPVNALNFPIGVKTFDVNDGAAQISFNPTDVNFVSALYDLFAECAERYETDKDKKFENNTAFFEYVRQRDAEVSDGVDRLFGEGAAAAVFQGHSAHAMAEGLPLWTNFFLAVIDTVPEEKSVITINFVKTFENGDFCALAGAPTGENYKPEDNFETFVILNY